MNRLNRILTILILNIIMSLLINSCRECKSYKFDFDSCILKKLKYNPNPDEKSPFFSETDTSNFIYSEFGIQIKFHAILYSSVINRPNFFTTVNATECFPHYYIQDKIEKIDVITLNNFDYKHSQNSNISDYFKAAYSSAHLSSIDSTINLEYGINHGGAYFDMINYSSDLNLILVKAPQADSLFRFIVKVTFKNKTFTDTTDMVKIIK